MVERKCIIKNGNMFVEVDKNSTNRNLLFGTDPDRNRALEETPRS
jgi:hypothetical protein